MPALKCCRPSHHDQPISAGCELPGAPRSGHKFLGELNRLLLSPGRERHEFRFSGFGAQQETAVAVARDIQQTCHSGMLEGPNRPGRWVQNIEPVGLHQPAAVPANYVPQKRLIADEQLLGVVSQLRGRSLFRWAKGFPQLVFELRRGEHVEPVLCVD
jgi:hypothetical protein